MVQGWDQSKVREDKTRQKTNPSVIALVYGGCQNKVPHTEWLKQQKYVALWFQRPEVYDQDAGRVIAL